MAYVAHAASETAQTAGPRLLAELAAQYTKCARSCSPSAPLGLLRRLTRWHFKQSSLSSQGVGNSAAVMAREPPPIALCLLPRSDSNVVHSQHSAAFGLTRRGNRPSCSSGGGGAQRACRQRGRFQVLTSWPLMVMAAVFGSKRNLSGPAG